ncbi:MAG: glutamine--fructose-6-phosphate transaminase (isomerizing) [Candidatus Bathyarchaeota archaeon]|jgi:glucosamine--fructose-6-phosphate aminotransferase (isomerizing)|nr:glutamine--fructose-6-phosphate transaminase (isomerizing) [Candidatus Bathyarchaeota archaeon]MDD4325431.1 glutamine--fructose-6-phosphate transaminase (isomerizing) [Candidatus Bathyarchaeota archaeon]MDI9577609.1 glutamine--fructose-6-phosphate transaminase (isomerizing) [Thermoproteota archaeon]MDT8781386.1 glutamine--fructose-6-phosphate transaminase (isomerizing) [Candidatus Bathyarchaeota archaeon]NLD66768.1 glutamine--fructose-6-phosphate transaminase (isomerizing) [Thermoproteota ar
MCGIFGCVLKESNAAPLIHSCLKRLEYRGYDSVGIATMNDRKITIKKDQGKIDEVHSLLNLDDMVGNSGIGHTRWATHGAPLKINSHPHSDCTGDIAVVHNGIIENFIDLKCELQNLGHIFTSKTDTEVISHLIEEVLKQNPHFSFQNAVQESLKRIEGSYAIAIMSTREPDKLICARNESPLVLGINGHGVFCASDIPAFLEVTNKAVIINNGELAILTADNYEIKNIANGCLITREPITIEWTSEMAAKKGYPHFMLKEIHEQPDTLRNTLRMQDHYLDLLTTFLDRANEVFLVACGTSYHACLAASYMFSKLAFLPTYPVYASEFIEQHGKSVNIDSTILAVSQSGETADTLAAVTCAQQRAATVLGLTNVIGSTLTRISRVYIGTQAGPEIGVAATKTFTSQLSVLAQLALKLSKKRGKISQDEMDTLAEKLSQLPEIVDAIVRTQEEKIKYIAKKYANSKVFFFLGRGISTATAYEGRLKLMEIAYIPSIAFPAGESKHGPISLIENGFPVIFTCPKDDSHKTVIGNIMEMKARGAHIISIIEEDDTAIKSLSDDYIEVPKGIPPVLSPIPFVVPLQLLAYYTALEKGFDPDMPRNLAKSVTVK